MELLSDKTKLLSDKTKLLLDRTKRMKVKRMFNKSPMDINNDVNYTSTTPASNAMSTATDNMIDVVATGDVALQVATVVGDAALQVAALQ